MYDVDPLVKVDRYMYKARVFVGLPLNLYVDIMVTKVNQICRMI